MKNVIQLRVKLVLTAALMMLITWIPKTAFAEPPVPTVNFSFDVSKQGSAVNQEIKIREYRSYYFAIQFDSFSDPDYYRVMALLGDGGRRPNGTPSNPGFLIPIHLKITKQGKASESIYDNTVETEGIYSIGHDKKTVGKFKRVIIIIDLKPGIYQVEANTIRDSSNFAGTPSQLLIEPHSQLKFIPNIK